jgi:tRNA A37 N6-isopentenylltransferase MiaA
MALTQKIFVDENNLNRDIGLDMDDLEKEHNLLRKQVDKVTIKLFAAMVDNGKFDNALELVNRLHSEKSYEIAMVYADRQNERLAKRIEKKMKINFDEKYLHEVYSDICQEGVSQALQTNQGRSISNQISNGIQKRSLNSKNPAKAGNKRLRDT